MASLSSLICKTHSEIKQMPLNPFMQSSPHKNPMIPCFKFPEFDYDLWEDKKVKNVKYSTTMSKPATVVYGSSQSSALYPQKSPLVMTKMPPAIGYSKKYHFQYAPKKSPITPKISSLLMTDFSDRKDNQHKSSL